MVKIIVDEDGVVNFLREKTDVKLELFSIGGGNYAILRKRGSRKFYK